jgi:hypothetical protein
MPSTRGGGRHDLLEGLVDSDDDFDPDYRESDDSDEEVPATMAQDRAQWVVDSQEAVEESYHMFLALGRQLWGEAFFQTGDVTKFAYFIYKHTALGANSSE